MHSTYFKNNYSIDSKDVAEPLCQLCCHGPCPHSNLWCGSSCPQQILTPFISKRDIHGIFSQGKCDGKDLIFYLQNVFLWGFQVGPVWRDYEARLDLQTWSTKNSMSSLFYKKITITSSHFFVLQNLTAKSLCIQVMILKSKIGDGKNLTWQGTSLVCSSTSSFVIKAVPVKPDYTSTWPIDEMNTVSVRLSKNTLTRCK